MVAQGGICPDDPEVDLCGASDATAKNKTGDEDASGASRWASGSLMAVALTMGLGGKDGSSHLLAPLMLSALLVPGQAADAVSTMSWNDPAKTTCGALKSFYKDQMCCGSGSKEVHFQLANFTSTSMFYWTKAGLEQIPFAKWGHFSPNDVKYRPYVADIPWPGDNFTEDHLLAWGRHVAKTSAADLLMMGFVSTEPHPITDVLAVPTLFNMPNKVEHTAIDYRLQFAADRGGAKDLGVSAMKGRLSNPAGRRLREHFYRYPDQCDATGIALEVFVRLLLLDQVEVFFRPAPRIGLFQDLYSDVPRRDFDVKDMSIAGWYASRYAEGYMASLENGGWVYPFTEQPIDTQMRAVGLDPTDASMDVNTAVGIGNVVGKRATDWLQGADLLQKGMDWVDEGGLQAIEEFHMTKKTWSSWIPSFAGAKKFQGIRPGVVTQQTFVTPSLGVFSFMYKDDADYKRLGFEASVPFFNQSDDAYLARSRAFMTVHTTALTDFQKAAAELANNKIIGATWMIVAFVKVLKKATASKGMSALEYQALYADFSMVTSGCAEYGGAHVAWRHKRTLYAGRPQTVIPRLTKRNKQFLAEFPGAATWKPMIPAGDHPEFPAGSAVIFNGFVAAGDHWFAKHFPSMYSMVNGKKASQDTGHISLTIPKGSFYWTNGPAADVLVGYDSLDAWVKELPKARVWAGVHFQEAGDAGLALGAKVGEACFNIQEKLKAGNMAATYTWSGRKQISRFNI